MTDTKTASWLVAEFGGDASMAHWTGLPATTIHGWKRSDRIPVEYHDGLFAHIEAYKIDCSREELKAMWPAKEIKTPDLERRDKAIVTLRNSGLTYQEIADEFGITRERVRQLLRKRGRFDLAGRIQ